MKQAAVEYIGRHAPRLLAVKVTGVECHNCLHAVVGSGEMCRCEKGRWADVPLTQVAKIGAWLRCRKFDSMEG